jgi:hypothetical protein
VAEHLINEQIKMHTHSFVLFFSEIPTVAIIEIPNKVTCPLCSGVSSDCPLSTNPAYLYAHPPPGDDSQNQNEKAAQKLQTYNTFN